MCENTNKTNEPHCSKDDEINYLKVCLAEKTETVKDLIEFITEHDLIDEYLDEKPRGSQQEKRV